MINALMTAVEAVRRFRLRDAFTYQGIIIIYIWCFTTQFVAYEGYGVSWLKVVLMTLAIPFMFFYRCRLTKAVPWAVAYFLSVWCVAMLHEEMRASTVWYGGMFLGMFVFVHSVIYTKNVFTAETFSNVLRCLILVWFSIYLLQQFCVLVGIYDFPIINLNNQSYLSITKMPLLTQEPSSSARMLAVFLFGYLRCKQLQLGRKLLLPEMIRGENRWVTIAFLWMMFTMGSGTAFVAVSIVFLYFMQWRNAVYIVPAVIMLFSIGTYLNEENFERAQRVAQATATGDVNQVTRADDSAADRVAPLMNTFLSPDLDKIETWIGKGTTMDSMRTFMTSRKINKLAIVEQYGLIAYLLSIFLVYSCIIYRFFSIETLLFVLLFGAALMNYAYLWGAMLVFIVIRYLQEQDEKGYVMESDLSV